jgi:hypothetical protein
MLKESFHGDAADKILQERAWEFWSASRKVSANGNCKEFRVNAQRKL